MTKTDLPHPSGTPQLTGSTSVTTIDVDEDGDFLWANGRAGGRSPEAADVGGAAAPGAFVPLSAAAHDAVVMPGSPDHQHRRLSDIERIVAKADLPAEVSANCLSVYRAIAEVEARAHGTTVEQVHFHEVYKKDVAKAKLKYLVQYGLNAYFSHKADEYGVYFFDPFYYENTEPFHESLRQVTAKPSANKGKLVPIYFGSEGVKDDDFFFSTVNDAKRKLAVENQESVGRLMDPDVLFYEFFAPS